MCLSRLHRVVTCENGDAAVVEDLDGTTERISLLALEGSAPRAGDWLIVHSGYAIARIDEETARATLADLRTVAGHPPSEAPS